MDDSEQDMVEHYERNIMSIQGELSEKNFLFQGLQLRLNDLKEAEKFL